MKLKNMVGKYGKKFRFVGDDNIYLILNSIGNMQVASLNTGDTVVVNDESILNSEIVEIW